MREVLAMARQVDEKDLGALSVSLARRVLVMALQHESPGERQQKETLFRLLASKRSQTLSLALTDRSCRSASAKRQVAAIIEAAERIGIDRRMPTLDRVELRALLAFGSTVPRVTAEAVAARLRREAAPFVLDSEPERLTEALLRIRTGGRRVNINYLGEEILGEAEADRRTEKYLALLDRPDVDAMSVKLSGVYSQINLLAPRSVMVAVIERLLPVLQKAQERGTLIYFDMEAFRDLEMTAAVVERLCELPGLLNLQLGVALQAYLPDTRTALRRLLDVAVGRVERGGVPLKLRLVKGANLATEAVEASYHRLACPIFPNKTEVDANYKRLLSEMLRPEYLGRIRIGLGSHNLFDQCYGLLLAEHRVASSMLDLEMLEGMAGATGRVLTRLARGALLYAPTVSHDNFPSAVSYLVRRLDENTGPENFLQTSVTMRPGDSAFSWEAQGFLTALELAQQPSAATFRTQDRTHPPALRVRSLQRSFDNCADTDWTRPANRAALDVALEKAKIAHFEIASVIAGEELRSGRSDWGTDPSRPHHPAYRVHLATGAEVDRALQVGAETERGWSEVPPKIRALMIERAADELEKARLRLVALMVLDAGKRPVEADIEVSEAIDFARYYAQNYLELGEQFALRPRGLTVVTPPFNFPLAIPLGGCLAALVSGNPVVLKPAPETRLVAWEAVHCLHRAGVPTDALSLVLCDDEEATPLICDPRVKTVVLTGGSSTARAFLRLRPGLHLLAETGGKNGIYVSALADRDAAIRAVVESAFGHAGQKCSAASLLVLEEEVFRDAKFKDTLLDATASLRVGSAWDLSSFVTPLIREPEGALRRILEGRSEALGGGRFELRPQSSPQNPQLVSPGILWGVSPGSFPHQTEFFGPVLSVLRAQDLAQGLALINGTPYGLTAGVFSLSESEQMRFVEGIEAGNVYVNRAITGAVVGRQPFGGFKDSCFGPGAKAGGPSYVLQFCHADARRALSQWPRAGAKSEPSLADVPAWLAPRRGTAVLGEENILRTLPASVLVLVGTGSTAEERELVQRACRAAGATFWEAQLGVTASREACEALAPVGPLRVRVLGERPGVLADVAAERGWSLLTDPVAADVRLEARTFVREQSLAIAYHRHGNLSLRGIHPFLRGLSESDLASI